MKDLIVNLNGEILTTTKDMADIFGKTHKYVLEALRNLECSDEFRGRNYRPSYYTSLQNKKLSCFTVTRDGFTLLGMGFTGPKASQWKEAYIEAFNKMESHIKGSDSLMCKINEALLIMEKDKATASLCSKGLNEWKKLKKMHHEEVERLVNESQFALNFA